MVDDELMTMPIYRGDWVSSREVHIDGVESVLHNERLIEAAEQVFDAEVVRPLIVFSNLTAPMPQNRKHTDVPTFRGVERSQYPAWVVSAMAASGLFERWRVKVATAVAWYYDGPNGGFSYWPDGGAAPEVTIEPPSNIAVVGDNDFMYHRVEAVGDGRFAMVPIDSLAVVRRRRRVAGASPRTTATSATSVATTSASRSRGRRSASTTPRRRASSTSTSTTSPSTRCSPPGGPTAPPAASSLPAVADPLHDRAFEAAVAAAYAGPLSTA